MFAVWKSTGDIYAVASVTRSVVNDVITRVTIVDSSGKHNSHPVVYLEMPLSKTQEEALKVSKGIQRAKLVAEIDNLKAQETKLLAKISQLEEP